MRIPINTPIIDQEEIEAVNSVLKTGSLTSSSDYGGNYVQKFEKIVRNFVKSKFVVAVSSGTSALQAALLTLDISPGDEILIPSFSFIATANAVKSVGAIPVFVDIVKENYTLNPKDLQKKITKKTRAIIPVHLYGNVAYLEDISEIAKKNNLHVVEDAAQSLGSFYKKKHVGTFFELGCCSTYPGKVMTSGEGGFVLTNNKVFRDKLLKIRNHGMQNKKSKGFGLNLRLSEIHAAIGTIQMKKLPQFLKSRKKNAKVLSEYISDLNVTLPHPREFEDVNWYLFTIATSKQNKLLVNLRNRGIEAESYYQTPIHRTSFYKQKISLPITDWAASNVVSLPIHPRVTQKNIEVMAKIMHDVL